MRWSQRKTLASVAAMVVATGLVMLPSSASFAAVTDPATVLPVGATGAIVVDDAHSHVFIAQPSDNAVTVTNLAGVITGSITGITDATQLVLNPASPVMYVSGPGQPTITQVNTKTLAKKTIALPADECAEYTTFTGDKLWFSYSACDDIISSGFGYLNPQNNAVTLFPASGGYPWELASQPGYPTRVAAFLPGFSGAQFTVWNFASGTPKLVTSAYPDLENCAQAAVFNAGKQVVFACGAPYEHDVYNTKDLSFNATLPSNTYPDAVAVSDTGADVALGVNGIYWADVYIQKISGGLPGTPVANYDFSYGTGLAADGLAWGASGLVYAIEAGQTDADPFVLHILSPLS